MERRGRLWMVALGLSACAALVLAYVRSVEPAPSRPAPLDVPLRAAEAKPDAGATSPAQALAAATASMHDVVQYIGDGGPVDPADAQYQRLLARWKRARDAWIHACDAAPRDEPSCSELSKPHMHEELLWGDFPGREWPEPYDRRKDWDDTPNLDPTLPGPARR